MRRSLLVLLAFSATTTAYAQGVENQEAATAVTNIKDDACQAGVVVRKGDDYRVIARRVFGDGRRWREIAVANPEVDPLYLKVWQCLRIVPAPPRDKLLGTVLALFVREQIGRPLNATDGGVVPEFSDNFEAPVVDCVALASADLTMEQADGLDDVCTMALITAWRIASGHSAVAATPTLATPP